MDFTAIREKINDLQNALHRVREAVDDAERTDRVLGQYERSGGIDVADAAKVRANFATSANARITAEVDKVSAAIMGLSVGKES